MGILGLTSALREMGVPENFREPIAGKEGEGKPLLLVDGLGWILGLLDHCKIYGVTRSDPKHEPISPRLEILGGLELIQPMVSMSYKKWCDAGFEVVVFMDGIVDTTFKRETINKREQQSFEEREINRLCCRGQDFRTLYSAELPSSRHNMYSPADIVEAVQRSTGFEASFTDLSLGSRTFVLESDDEDFKWRVLDANDRHRVIALSDRKIYMRKSFRGGSTDIDIQIYTNNPTHILDQDSNRFFHIKNALPNKLAVERDHSVLPFQHSMRVNDMFGQEFRNALAELGVKIVTCFCEADFEIPLFANEPDKYDPNWRGRRTFVASADSDFCFVKGCRWIKFNPSGELDIKNGTVGVWRAEKVAPKLDSELFAAVALLMGNDHTKYLLNNHCPQQFIKKRGLQRLQGVISFLSDLRKTRSLDQIYESIESMIDRDDIAKVIKFNRAVYSGKPVYQSCKMERIEGFEDSFDLNPLDPEQQIRNVCDEFRMFEDELYRVGDFPGLHDRKMSKGLERIFTQVINDLDENKIDQVKFLIFKHMRNEWSSFPYTSDIGMMALEKAIGTSSQEMAVDDPPFFDDILLARTFQYLWKGIMRYMFLNPRVDCYFESAEQILSVPKPSEIFNAAVFHNKCCELRRLKIHGAVVNAFGLSRPPMLGEHGANVVLPDGSIMRYRTSCNRFYNPSGRECTYQHCNYPHSGKHRRVRGKCTERTKTYARLESEAFSPAARCFVKQFRIKVNEAFVAQRNLPPNLKFGDIVEFEAFLPKDRDGKPSDRCSIHAVNVTIIEPKNDGQLKLQNGEHESVLGGSSCQNYSSLRGRGNCSVAGGSWTHRGDALGGRAAQGAYRGWPERETNRGEGGYGDRGAPSRSDNNRGGRGERGGYEWRYSRDNDGCDGDGGWTSY